MGIFLTIAGSQNHFQAAVWLLKKISKCCNFLNFLREMKDQVSQSGVFINAITLSHLNSVPSRFCLNHINK